MSLYLKYRPATFDDLVGQDALKSILLHQIQTGQVFHNYLFFGGRGTGKTSTARLLAQAVNCRKLEDGSPDFSDPLATLIRDNKTIDVIEIDAASHTGVDNIREEIIEKSSYPPAQLRKKVYIIDEVHMLSKGAFNALLKIMEEPPSYLMFILATTELHKVPETIVSRCQVFNFKQHSVQQVVTQLQMIATKEGIKTTEEGLSMIAKLSGGAMRDAIKYLEQVSMLGEISPANVSQFLGIASDDMIGRVIQSIIDGDSMGLIELLESLASGGTDMTQLIKDCMSFCGENFNKNPQVYAKLAHKFKELYQNVKWYPHGLLAWKVTFGSEQQQEYGDQRITQQNSALYTGKKEEVVETNSKKAEIQNGSLISDLQSQKSISINTDQFLETLIAACDKTMIKSGLKNYTMIDRIHDGIIEAVIINEQFYNLMNKGDILDYLSDLGEQSGYGKLVRKLSYMTKEDFVSKSLLA